MQILALALLSKRNYVVFKLNKASVKLKGYAYAKRLAFLGQELSLLEHSLFCLCELGVCEKQGVVGL